VPIILIKNGLTYDGSGEPALKKDILIRRGHVARLGSFPKKHADVVIDAAGATVTPGFIDINSSFDHYLGVFNEPSGESLIRAGITTILGGNCGSSLAPVFGNSLLSLRKWTDFSKINVGWHKLPELLKILERRGLGVNFGTLVGHGTVRRGLLGEDFRDLTDREMAAMKEIIGEALKDGAFGLSFGLEYVHAKMTPYRELIEVAKIAAQFQKPVAVHLRDSTDGLDVAVGEIIKLARDSAASLEINHFEPVLGFREKYIKARGAIEAETAVTHINFDCNSDGILGAPIYQLLPPNLKRGNLETMNESIKEAHLEKEILEHLKKVVSDEITISYAPPPLQFLNGRTLVEFAASHELKKEEALFRLMHLSRLRATVLLKTVDEKIMAEFLASPASFISSGDTGQNGIFANFLGWANKNKMPLEQAIAKMTSGPAAKFKIKKRGLIKEDYFADIVVLRDLKVKDVVVNGKIALADGVATKSLSGSVLRSD